MTRSGKKSAFVCIMAGIFTLLHGKIRTCYHHHVGKSTSSPFVAARAHAMNHYGSWEVVQSNDPLVQQLPKPRIVVITPGKFRIGRNVFGGFRVESPPSSSSSSPDCSEAGGGGILVSMTMYNIGFLKKMYSLVPMDPDRMALFGTGSHKSIFYILQRLNNDGVFAQL